MDDTQTKTTEYPRVLPTEEMIKKWSPKAQQFIMSNSRPELIKFLTQLMVENECLTTEVNQHREVRGFELLPVYQPQKQTLRSQSPSAFLKRR